MYHFLVVEDEKHVRDAVVSVLRELNGEGGVYSAENGLEALRLMESREIHGVITDIMMPIKDGISLIKTLYKQRSRTLVAILSGYDEFEYVQAALSYGAMDYILKPVEHSQIVKIYYKMLRQLKSRESLERELADTMNRLDEIRPYIRQRYYFDLIGGRITENAFEGIRPFLGLKMRNAPIRIIVLEIDEYESGLTSGSNEESLSLYTLTEIMESLVAEYQDCDFFSLSSNMAAIVWCPWKDVQETGQMVVRLELLASELAELYKVVLNIGISEPVESPFDAGRADLSAREAIHYKLLYGSGQIFAAELLGNDNVDQEFQFDTNEIIESIWLNKPEHAQLLISNFVNRIRLSQGKYRLTSIWLLCQKLLIDCLMILERECGDWFGQKGSRLLATNFQNYSIDDVEQFFRQFVTEICAQIGASRKNDRKKTIHIARQIIEGRYATDLSIEKIAKELHYSPNYFGQLFKAETGMSVNEYINQVRIQKAKRMLLEGGYRIGQIAERVGFGDQQYFARVFKKVVGCMPSEYIPQK
ncbi:MAG: helix-turn-helix domain-containing protein [Lachnospiraceae bacterium]|jgi:two-component system response regulator YesN|nr:helix-turn-helix domain-containing protein [Lachnospiraceae bacterium]